MRYIFHFSYFTCHQLRWIVTELLTHSCWVFLLFMMRCARSARKQLKTTRELLLHFFNAEFTLRTEAQYCQWVKNLNFLFIAFHSSNGFLLFSYCWHILETFSYCRFSSDTETSFFSKEQESLKLSNMRGSECLCQCTLPLNLCKLNLTCRAFKINFKSLTIPCGCH